MNEHNTSQTFKCMGHLHLPPVNINTSLQYKTVKLFKKTNYIKKTTL